MRPQRVVAKWVRKSVFTRAGGFTYRNNKGEGVLQCHILSLYFTSFIKSTCILCIVNLHIMAHRSEGPCKDLYGKYEKHSE